jgi:hypothetical protein
VHDHQHETPDEIAGGTITLDLLLDGLERLRDRERSG